MTCHLVMYEFRENIIQNIFSKERREKIKVNSKPFFKDFHLRHKFGRVVMFYQAKYLRNSLDKSSSNSELKFIYLIPFSINKQHALLH